MSKETDKEQFLKNIAELKQLNQTRYAKYTRNIRRYNNSPIVNLNDVNGDRTVGYNSDIHEIENDTTNTPAINIIKQCIDTLFARISEQKVRAYFNCVDGSYDDMCIVREAQKFFDLYFDLEDVNKKVSEAFRDSCIFDTGIIYVDNDTKNITRALPWQVYFRPAEMTYNNLTRVYYERTQFPATMIPQSVKDKCKKVDESKYYIFGTYYDVLEHKKVYYLPELKYTQIEEYDGDRTPFILIHYNNPIMGTTSLSVVDMLNDIQIEINELTRTVKDCSQLTNPNMVFVPKGTNIKPSQIDTRVGNIFEFDVNHEMSGAPITVATSKFIDEQYREYIEYFCNKARQLVGLDELLTNGQKPSGLNSGVAINSMEDIQAGRFQAQINQVVRCYVDIAKTCMKVFPKGEDILPKDSRRLNVKWADIVKESKKMNIQFSAADQLSKDPQTKLQQLLALSQGGVIPKNRVAQFMNIPDLEAAYTLSNNAINAVLSTIDDCLRKDDYEIPEFIPRDMLKDEILNTQLSLRAANYEDNKENINKLTKLYQRVCDLDKELEENLQKEQQAEQEKQQQEANDNQAEAVGEQFLNDPEGTSEQIAQMAQQDPNNVPVGPNSTQEQSLNNIPVDSNAFRSDLDVSTK